MTGPAFHEQENDRLGPGRILRLLQVRQRFRCSGAASNAFTKQAREHSPPKPLPALVRNSRREPNSGTCGAVRSRGVEFMIG